MKSLASTQAPRRFVWWLTHFAVLESLGACWNRNKHPSTQAQNVCYFHIFPHQPRAVLFGCVFPHPSTRAGCSRGELRRWGRSLPPSPVKTNFTELALFQSATLQCCPGTGEQKEINIEGRDCRKHPKEAPSKIVKLVMTRLVRKNSIAYSRWTSVDVNGR